MNCNSAARLIEAYADGEIGGLRGWAIRRHLRACPRCAAQLEELAALRSRLRVEVPYYPAPPQLQARIQGLLADAPAAAPAALRPERDRWRWLAGGALGGCAASILALVAGNAVIDWRAGENMAVEAVAIHVRATLNDHLIEVASSDRHTVKPWLSARLDYSPPVRDLADEGFALIGGRLETLHSQRVAILVYRYRQHTIDVFVRPEPAPSISAPRSVRGFNVAHASGSGMDWLAVSDVSADILGAFVQRLARAEVSQ